MGKNRPYEAIGGRLRSARKSASLPLRDIAKSCSLTVQAISQWESGKYPITADGLIAYANRTGASLDWILMGKNKGGPHGMGGGAMGGTDVPILHSRDVQRLEEALKTAPLRHQAKRPVGPRAFAIAIDDKANEPTLMVGDIAVFDPDAPFEPGKIVIALVGKDREPIIRRLVELETGYLLEPVNKAWGPKTIANKRDGEIIAVMTEFTRSG